jgi:hypothetical protein
VSVVHQAQGSTNACLVLSSRTKWLAIKIKGIQRQARKSIEWGVISSSHRLREVTK